MSKSVCRWKGSKLDLKNNDNMSVLKGEKIIERKRELNIEIFYLIVPLNKIGS